MIRFSFGLHGGSIWLPDQCSCAFLWDYSVSFSCLAYKAKSFSYLHPFVVILIEVGCKEAPMYERNAFPDRELGACSAFEVGQGKTQELLLRSGVAH